MWRFRHLRERDENNDPLHAADCRAKFSPGLMAYTPDFRPQKATTPLSQEQVRCRSRRAQPIPQTIQTGYREGVGLDARLTHHYISGGELLLHQRRQPVHESDSVCRQQ